MLILTTLAPKLPYRNDTLRNFPDEHFTLLWLLNFIDSPLRPIDHLNKQTFDAIYLKNQLLNIACTDINSLLILAHAKLCNFIMNPHILFPTWSLRAAFVHVSSTCWKFVPFVINERVLVFSHILFSSLIEITFIGISRTKD